MRVFDYLYPSSGRGTTMRRRSIRNQASRRPDGDQTLIDGAYEDDPNTNSSHSSQPFMQRAGSSYRILHFPSFPWHNGSGSNDRHDDERDLIIEGLKTELEISQRNFEAEFKKQKDESQKEFETYHVHYNKLAKDLQDLQKKSETNEGKYREVCKERDSFQNNLKAHNIYFEKQWKESQEAWKKNQEAWKRECNTLKELYDGLSKSYNESQALIETQKLNIRELTVTISNSVNTSGTTTRDDDYFEAEFAYLAGAIHQWVFRCFRNISSINYKDLPPTLLESLRKSVLQYDDLPDTTISSKEIEAIIAERLYSHVFRPSFALTIGENFHNLEYIYNSLSGTDLAKREWHAQTVSKIFAGDRYEDHLRNNTLLVEDELLECSGVLSKGKNEEQRRKTLSAIVERAARLYTEIFQQISPFILSTITPGQPYDPTFMEDISGSVDGGDIYIVQMVHSPPVLRWGFDDDGKFLQAPIVVRKGAVIAMISGN